MTQSTIYPQTSTEQTASCTRRRRLFTLTHSSNTLHTTRRRSTIYLSHVNVTQSTIYPHRRRLHGKREENEARRFDVQSFHTRFHPKVLKNLKDTNELLGSVGHPVGSSWVCLPHCHEYSCLVKCFTSEWSRYLLVANIFWKYQNEHKTSKRIFVSSVFFVRIRSHWAQANSNCFCYENSYEPV